MYFSKYLSNFNYDPFVITVSEKSASYKNLDEVFNDHIKDVKTYKTVTSELVKLYSFLSTGNSKTGIPNGQVGKNKKKNLFDKIAAFIRANFFIPDARIGWNYHALKKARKVIKKENINLIITTGPPHSTHLIGLKLKKEFQLKWVADFRDPWSEVYYNHIFKRLSWAVKKDSLLELKVLKNADRVLTVGMKLKKLLAAKINTNRNKFHHIYNGYDAEIMENLKVDKHDHFELTFVGVLTSNQPYVCVIEALKFFFKNRKPNNVKFCFAGNIQPDILADFKKELPFIEINDNGFVSHQDSLQLMKNSQLLINFLADMKESEILISGKQMEYIATGNPILCIGNQKGESAIILKEIKNSRVFDKTQINQIAEFINYIYDYWVRNKPFLNETNSQSIKSKSRYETSIELVHFLNKV
jgi:glycosyltransferase involved in cell wall biosynthesis